MSDTDVRDSIMEAVRTINKASCYKNGRRRRHHYFIESLHGNFLLVYLGSRTTVNVREISAEEIKGWVAALSGQNGDDVIFPRPFPAMVEIKAEDDERTKTYKDALEFYACRDNWGPVQMGHGEGYANLAINNDEDRPYGCGGERARKALAEFP